MIYKQRPLASWKRAWKEVLERDAASWAFVPRLQASQMFEDTLMQKAESFITDDAFHFSQESHPRAQH